MLVGRRGIVPIYHAGEADGQLYIAMRHVDRRHLVDGLFLAGIAAYEGGNGLPEDVMRARAIAASDEARRSVISQLFKVHITNGILGTFGFTKAGDMTPDAIQVFQVDTARPPARRSRPHDGRHRGRAAAVALYSCDAGGVAQRTEQEPSKLLVAGSIPAAPASIS